MQWGKCCGREPASLSSIADAKAHAPGQAQDTDYDQTDGYSMTYGKKADVDAGVVSSGNAHAKVVTALASAGGNSEACTVRVKAHGYVKKEDSECTVWSDVSGKWTVKGNETNPKIKVRLTAFNSDSSLPVNLAWNTVEVVGAAQVDVHWDDTEGDFDFEIDGVKETDGNSVNPFTHFITGAVGQIVVNDTIEITGDSNLGLESNSTAETSTRIDLIVTVEKE